jgi:hypothetical protein
MQRQMTIDAKRLAALLSSTGFELHLVDSRFGRIHFIRRSNIEGLYESVVIEHQGKRRELVYGGVGISITKSVMQKELGQVEWPAHLADDKQRLWTVVESQSKAVEWERRLAANAGELASDLAKREGPRLLKDTEEIVRAASAYLRQIDEGVNVVEQNKLLRLEVTDEGRRVAKQFGMSPIVVHVDHAADVYELTCLCILRFQAEVESTRPSYLDQNLAINKHLACLIEIVADELLHRYRRLPMLE